jgi:pimeloyl-ACP methyl ester carboxylesterase
VSRVPTVVLAHGAFTTSLSWAMVMTRLLESGVEVIAPPLSARSLTADGAYLRSFVEQLDRPVLLVGHSYGGAVATAAGVANNVGGVVYVASLPLAQGESIAQLGRAYLPDGCWRYTVATGYPGLDDLPDVAITVDSARFEDLLMRGVDPALGELYARAQAPLSVRALHDVVREPAWLSKATWGVVTAADRFLPPRLQRFAYRRAGAASITELDAPHFVTVSAPDRLASIIRAAARELSDALPASPPSSAASAGTTPASSDAGNQRREDQ